jgi:hypothetical protein
MGFERYGLFSSITFARVKIVFVPFERELVEARIVLNLIASADMPKVAWDALEAGLDGPAIRRLAALVQPTFFEVAEVLPRAKQELGLGEISIGEAALRVAKQIASEILKNGDDPLRHLEEFKWLWFRSNYAHEICSLGTLRDDVWVAQSAGRSDEEIRLEVVSILTDFAQ